jgi:hypothetical protein
VERGLANPTLDAIDRIAQALGLRLVLDVSPPVFLGTPSTTDVVHARCSAYVDRRLRGAGWSTAREVALIDGRYRGWIDLLAFDPSTGRLLIIEIKTRLDDVGALERQLSWYEGAAVSLARERAWRARSVRSVVLLLASDEVEQALQANREVLAAAFPCRHEVLDATEDHGRGLALIDPRSRRRDWLMRSRIDGRRSAAPYRHYSDAARRFAA